MSQFLTRLIGPAPMRTLVKLLILSVIVGLVLSKMGWKPQDVPERVWHFVLDMGLWFYASLGKMSDIILVGLMIVVPIFIIRRLMNGGKNS